MCVKLMCINNNDTGLVSSHLVYGALSILIYRHIILFITLLQISICKSVTNNIKCIFSNNYIKMLNAPLRWYLSKNIKLTTSHKQL